MPEPSSSPYSYVKEFFRNSRGPALGRVTGADELTVSPDGSRIAFTATVTLAVDRDPVRRVGVVGVSPGAPAPVLHSPEEGESFNPSWSPTGDRLAWIARTDTLTRAEVSESLDGPGSDLRTATATPPDVEGTIEFVQWSPDGGSLLLTIAEPGAEISDVAGSGRLPPHTDLPSWAPEVQEGPPTTGRRRAWILDPATGGMRPVGNPGRTVWQAAWAGPERLLCVTSTTPGESGWYNPSLDLVDLATGSTTPVLEPERQIALPAADRDGRRLSAVVGAMSDRGIHAGRLVVLSGPGHAAEPVDTAGADVSDQHWLDHDRLVFAGLSGLTTVIGVHTLSTGKTELLWESDQTCGGLLPSVGVAADTVVALVHGYGRPPALARIREGRADVLVDLGHDGSRWTSALGGSLHPLTWSAPDGRPVQGLLAVPPGPGPHPLVVHLHGGPVWAWRNEWSMHYEHTPLLVGRGYAVLHPNIRGSIGHGQQFVLDGLLDMGGADAQDALSGIDALVARGLVDPRRVAVTGNSYGGFLSAWLIATSDRFAAAVARSPVTDWISQHHASNLPGFDRAALVGDPLASDSDYRTRSPLYLADAVHTPVMLMAGAKDLATPPEQAAMFHNALVERGRTSTLVVYPEEGHGVRSHPAVVDHCARLIAFLEQHMPAGAVETDNPPHPSS